MARSLPYSTWGRLRERDPGDVCAYCATPLAFSFGQTGSEHLAWEADGWELALLEDGEPVWQPLYGHLHAHRDHVVPKAMGGTDELDNLVLACARCNLIKKAQTLLLFLAQRAGCPIFKSVGGKHVDTFARAWGRAA